MVTRDRRGGSFCFTALHGSWEFLLQLGNCSVDLSACNINVTVNLGLVFLINERYTEEQDVSEDEDSDAIEDRSNICQQPHNHCQLEGIHQILDQKEAAHLLQHTVDGGETGIHVLAEGLGGHGDIFLHQSLEGMSFAGLLHSLDDGFVDAERDGDTEQGQQQVGDHADHAKRCQRKQQQQRHAKHHT